jgi:hypothetical protein
MLFDLRGRGRRRTVQVIYLGLALLMGVGLVGFGIGGGFGSTGIVDALKGKGGAEGGGGIDTRLKTAEKRVAVVPTDAAAWAQIAHLRFLQAGQSGNYDQAQQTFTAKGRDELQLVRQAWNRYLGLNPRSPDANLANEMVQALGEPGGLNDYSGAARAAEFVAAARPGAAIYARLAGYAYLAGQTRKGDLAAAKALGLAPAAQRSALKAQLEQTKAQAASGGGRASPGAPTTG